jgi:antirestriction protein ArdC
MPKALPYFQQKFSPRFALPRPSKIFAGRSLTFRLPILVPINFYKKGRPMTTVTPLNPKQQPISRRDIHQHVTDTIIQQLEAGTVPWHKPWNGGNDRLLSIPQNFTTGKRYRGINILLLWTSANNQQFASDEWASFKQWQGKKEVVRKGEKGSLIVYYDTFEKEVEDEIKKIPFLKMSHVFNRCQLVSYEAAKPEELCTSENLVKRIEHVEKFIKNTNVEIEHTGFSAYYRPTLDKIVMPWPEAFIQTETCTPTEGYYSTLLHELTHWTGYPSRLDRKGGKKFGDNGYATEELIAELGAAFLCTEFGIATADKGDHASYIKHWLEVLKENKHCIITAASEASKACDYLQSLQPD